MTKVVHENTCTIKCTDTNKDAQADVVSFTNKSRLLVNVAGNDIHMNYTDKHGIYVGSMSGLEFTSQGPKITVITQGRIR